MLGEALGNVQRGYSNMTISHAEATALVARSDEIMRRTPPDVEELQELVTAAVTTTSLDHAVEALRLIIRTEPRNAQAYWDVGMILEYKAQFPEAARMYQRLLRLSPGLQRAEARIEEINEYLAALRVGRPYLGPIMDSQQNPTGERHPPMERLIRGECTRWSGKEFRALEIGSWAGGSALRWAKAIAELCDRKGFVVCVDPWREFWDMEVERRAGAIRMNEALKSGEVFRLFLHNVKAAGLEDLISPLRGSNTQMLPLLADEMFDFVYVDGSHSYEHCAYDISQAKRLVRDGQVVAGDDLVYQLHERDVEDIKQSIAGGTEIAVDPDEQKPYFPGVTLAVAEAFGEVLSCETVWAVRRRGSEWENVAIDV